MTDQPISPGYGKTPARARRSAAIAPAPIEAARQPEQRKLSFIATLDKPLLVILGLLLAIGMMMVYSTTFDYSLATRGSATAMFVQDHLRNFVLSALALGFFALIDYRFWRRFAVIILLATIGALIAVLLFGDDTLLNARRSLINGRFQPGELAEFTIVFYMAAWLGSKNTKVQSFIYGMIPFLTLVGILAGLVALQPDLSSVLIIVITAGIMFFLAGANFTHLIVAGGAAASLGLIVAQNVSYVGERFSSFGAGLNDLTQTNYHTQQAIIAFLNGGWFGLGLGEGKQKFGFLPAPHTDSIFAVIGEELGVLGATLVVLLFVAFAIRGYQIARRATDPFGALLAVGFTTWVIIRALLNIAVMTGRLPSTGVPLPFISYGGSALMVLMSGVGLMLSVHRVSALRQAAPERRNTLANHDRSWGNRRTRLSSTGRRRSYPDARPRNG